MSLRRSRYVGRLLRAGVPVGVVATATMDVAMLAAGRVGDNSFRSERLGPEYIGRWAAGLVRGRWRHDDITREARVTGEAAIGIATHYATGMMLSTVFLVVRPRSVGVLRAALAYGVATAVLPLLVLFPSLGYGWLGLRSGEAARMDRIMLLGHTAFGLGIGIGARRYFASARGGDLATRRVLVGEHSQRHQSCFDSPEYAGGLHVLDDEPSSQ